MALPSTSQYPRNQFPRVAWGDRTPNGLSSQLLALLESNTLYSQTFWPTPTQILTEKKGRSQHKTAKELATILFANTSPHNKHFEHEHGLEHYTISVNIKIRRFRENFEKAMIRLKDTRFVKAVNWHRVRDICPFYDRLRPLLGEYVESCSYKLAISSKGPETVSPTAFFNNAQSMPNHLSDQDSVITPEAPTPRQESKGARFDASNGMENPRLNGNAIQSRDLGTGEESPAPPIHSCPPSSPSGDFESGDGCSVSPNSDHVQSAHSGGSKLRIDSLSALRSDQLPETYFSRSNAARDSFMGPLAPHRCVVADYDASGEKRKWPEDYYDHNAAASGFNHGTSIEREVTQNENKGDVHEEENWPYKDYLSKASEQKKKKEMKTREAMMRRKEASAQHKHRQEKSHLDIKQKKAEFDMRWAGGNNDGEMLRAYKDALDNAFNQRLDAHEFLRSWNQRLDERLRALKKEVERKVKIEPVQTEHRGRYESSYKQGLDLPSKLELIGSDKEELFDFPVYEVESKETSHAKVAIFSGSSQDGRSWKSVLI